MSRHDIRDNLYCYRLFLSCGQTLKRLASDFSPEADFKSRSMTKEDFPGRYMYRDIGRKYWEATHTWVEEYLSVSRSKLFLHVLPSCFTVPSVGCHNVCVVGIGPTRLGHPHDNSTQRLASWHRHRCSHCETVAVHFVGAPCVVLLMAPWRCCERVASCC